MPPNSSVNAFCRIVEAACWAHARRKIYHIHAATASPIAEGAIQRITALYEFEDRARGRPPDERRRPRQAEAAPRLAELRAWLDQQRARLPAGGKLAGALRYSLNRWPALTATSTTAGSRSTTTLPSGPCARSRSGAKTTCSWAPTQAASALRSSTP